MPPRKKNTEVSAPVVQAPPPIENDIFADDIKWLKENAGNSNINESTPVTSNITNNTQPVSYISKVDDHTTNNTVPDYQNDDNSSNYYTPITTPNTNPYPVPTTVPLQPIPVTPVMPVMPITPTIPVVPNIPNYENLKYNIMQNQNPNQTPIQQAYINETSLWSLEWTIPTIRSVDINGTEIASYKDVVCSIRNYANDAYSIKQVSDASRWVFAMIHTTMDAIRKHSNQINVDPTKDVDYLAIMDPGMLEILTSFRKHMLDKRLGYPRISVKCRYGFKMPDSSVDIKVEAYEHTDPLEFYVGTMTSLEPMRRIENMHRKLEEQIIEQRKQVFGTGQQVSQVEPAKASPVTNYTQASSPASEYNNSNAGKASNPNAGSGTDNILDCKTDDDAQAAPFNTLLAYHATRVYRKDGKFNFYMPVAGSDQRARPKGIYAYEQGRGASTVIEQSFRDGRLPPLQNGEATDYDVTIIALKLPTQSGAAKYEVKDIIRAAQ